MTQELLTSRHIAEQLGCDPATVVRKAIAHDIGRPLTPRLRVYVQDDVERLRLLIGQTEGKPGRPVGGKRTKTPSRKPLSRKSPP